MHTTDQIRSRVNDHLRTVLRRRQNAAAAIDPSYGRLWVEIERLGTAGGKRLRAVMTVLAYQASSGEHSGIYDVACAVELLHLALLVHDDIIDRDDRRYGQPTIGHAYRTTYANVRDGGHFADGAAMLAGDALIAEAYRLVAGSGFPTKDATKVTCRLSDAVFHVVGGELLDVEGTFSLDSADSLLIAREKTAFYSCVLPLCSGAELAGASQEQLARIEEFGIALGIAYQIADDLLGMFGDESVTGKSVNGDIREGKPTLLLQEALRWATPAQRGILEAAVGELDATADQIQAVRDVVVATGAKAAAEAVLQDYAQQARDALADIGWDAEATAVFSEIITGATKRSR